MTAKLKQETDLMLNNIFIIAEAGVNHNGSLELAKKLIDAAADSGADAVKFQTFKASNLSSCYAEKAAYQKKATAADESQLQMLKRLELPYEAHMELIDYCKRKNIQFLSTPFDLESIDFLVSLDLPVLKIPSGEITNLPYLRKINDAGKKVILSTGMATLDEVGQALAVLKDCEVSLLHCTTEYPCPYEDVNLKAMLTMKEKFGLPVGYSDHTKGIEVPVAAAALGAEIIEKHFTLDKTMEGPDHKASLEPDELKAMVQSIRNIEKALGSREKKPSASELKNISVARKSIVAKRGIKAGEIFTEENIITKRPALGISPMEWDKIIGSKALKNYNVDDFI